jgi:hypothetical protein
MMAIAWTSNQATGHIIILSPSRGMFESSS